MSTILIVDDRELNRSFLTTLLQYGGYRLLEAANGAEGLNKVRVERPELIITDILMPEMDGYEFVRKVRTLEIPNQPQIIFYSATYLEHEAMALARACGVSRVICKPAEPEQVLKVVNEALTQTTHDEASVKAEAAGESEAVKTLSNKLYHKVKELEELNNQLEHRVAERTSELERANRFLQEQIVERQKAETELARSNEERLRIRGEFLSHVSHELRSPLGVVYQFVTILLDELGGPLGPDQREYLEITLRNINQLKYMIDDLLEASRADVGKLTIRRSSIHLNDVISQAVKSQRSVAAEKGISLECTISGDLPVVYADPARVSQILTNLLDNATKFSPPKSAITLEASVFSNDANFVCISVADSGCGIKPEHAERIFDRLYQEKNTIDATRQGLGLGLYICKQLVTLHGGSIWVETKEGNGSTFHFTLPIFTIKSMIAPLFGGEGQLPASIALLTVEVVPTKGWRTEIHRERSLHRIQQVLERCVLPDLDVLLPAENCAGLDLFAIVARTDERGARVIHSRIREQLGRLDDVSGKEIQSLNSRIVDLAPLMEGVSREEFVSRVGHHLQCLLKTLKE